MANPMRTFITDDGRKFLIPGDRVRDEPEVKLVYDDGYHCDCHKRMGNDFWFLPIGSCLRKDKTCDNPERFK